MNKLLVTICNTIKANDIKGYNTTDFGHEQRRASSNPIMDKLVGLLDPQGFHYEGGGFFSGVWSHDSEPESVFKVGLKASEDGWLKWAEYSLEHQGEPLIPLIHDVFYIGDNLFIAHMEKVTVKQRTFEWRHNKDIQWLVSACPVYSARRFHQLNKLFRSDVELTNNIVREKETKHHSNYLVALSILGEYLKPIMDLYELGFWYDIKCDNLGFNSEGKLINLDPCAWLDELENKPNFPFLYIHS